MQFYFIQKLKRVSLNQTKYQTHITNPLKSLQCDISLLLETDVVLWCHHWVRHELSELTIILVIS